MFYKEPLIGGICNIFVLPNAEVLFTTLSSDIGSKHNLILRLLSLNYQKTNYISNVSQDFTVEDAKAISSIIPIMTEHTCSGGYTLKKYYENVPVLLDDIIYALPVNFTELFKIDSAKWIFDKMMLCWYVLRRNFHEDIVALVVQLLLELSRLDVRSYIFTH